MKYSRNYQDAEDNLQDSFLTIFKKIDQYKFQGSFEGWLKRITVHTTIQKYRKQNPISLENDFVHEPVEEETIEEGIFNVDELLGFVRQLPDRYRMVFNLSVLDGYAHKEIAELLGISEGTSKSNLSRARGILKEQIMRYQKDKN